MKPEANASSSSGAAAPPARLVLKVDIDTRIGLLEGMSNLLDILDGYPQVKAGFYVAMGPDHSGRALKRLLRPGFLKKQLKSGAASSYGLKTMLYGLVLPGPIIARAAPHLFRELVYRGHEVGLHGWDHVFWHDRLTGLNREAVERQLGLAACLYKEILGFKPATFASPGWQITDQAVQALVRLGITHISATRGKSAYWPVVNGRALPILELPTTMPTLDEVLGLPGLSSSKAAAYLAGKVKSGGLNVYTMHGEVEGRNQAHIFREFMAILHDRGTVFETPAQAALREISAGPATDEIAWGRASQRAGLLSCQASCLNAHGDLVC